MCRGRPVAGAQRERVLVQAEESRAHDDGSCGYGTDNYTPTVGISSYSRRGPGITHGLTGNHVLTKEQDGHHH